MIEDDRIKKGRCGELVCVNPGRNKFSSRCSKSQHGNCNGNVLKSRSEDGFCQCYCHVLKQSLVLVFSTYGKNDFVLKI